MVPLGDAQTAKLGLELSEICGVPAAVGVFLGRTPEEGKSADRVLERQEGRAALSILLGQIGVTSEDVSLVQFPHPKLSVSHTDAVRAACVLGAGQSRVSGVGIDIELPRIFSPRVSRFFLTESEMSALPAMDCDTALRLWTVKEAVFKSDPDNEERVLRHYRVDDVLARSGVATLTSARAGEGSCFWYSSQPFQGGWLSVAASFVEQKEFDLF